MYANSNIIDIGFFTFGSMPKFSNVTFLDFCGCKFLQDDSVIAISRNCKSLEYFNLTWCLSLTDKAIVEGVAMHLTQLSLLSIYGLQEMTDKAMNALEASPLKYSLRTLDINGCKEITHGNEQFIKERFPNVEVTIFHS